MDRLIYSMPLVLMGIVLMCSNIGAWYMIGKRQVYDNAPLGFIFLYALDVITIFGGWYILCFYPGYEFMVSIGAAYVACRLSANGGSIKDSPYEGFKFRSYWQSNALGFVIGLLTLPLTGSYIGAFFCAIGIERFLIEGYKFVFRPGPPSKFSRVITA